MAVLEQTIARGRPPTVQELADALGIKRASTYVRVKELREIGWLRNDPRIALGNEAMRALARQASFTP